MQLVEYKVYDTKDLFLSNASEELDKSGIVGYKTKFIVFRVGFDVNKNPEYGKYFNKIKSTFDMKYADDPAAPEFPLVNTKEYDEKYFVIKINGEALDGKYTGKYLFNSLEDVFNVYNENMSVSEYTDFVLEDASWSE